MKYKENPLITLLMAESPNYVCTILIYCLFALEFPYST